MLFRSNSMMDAATAAAGGHVDAAVAFYIDVQGLIESGSVNVIGATGSPKVDKNLLLTNHKLKDAGALTANYAIFSSVKMNKDRFGEIHDMLIKVNGSNSVVTSYKKDQLNIVNLNPEQSLEWYANERVYWNKQINLINGAK